MAAKILIVEDEAAIQELIIYNLQQAGYETVSAENAEKAMSIINNALPDLILLDVNLPKKNGHEVLEYIKTSENLKQIPVIMLTTSSSDKDVLLSYKNHANCFITKPLDVNNFLTIVSSIESFWINIVKLPKNKKQ